MKFSDFLPKAAIIKDLKSLTKEDAIEELSEALRRAHNLKGIKVSVMVDVLLKREKIGSTGIGNGVAVPHAKMEGLKNVVGAFGRSSAGIDFDAIDGEPVHLIFLIMAPADRPEANLQALQRVSQAIRQANFCRFLKEAKEVKDIIDLFNEVDELLDSSGKSVDKQ